MGKFARFLSLLAFWSFLLVAASWGIAALWFDGPASRPLAAVFAAAYALAIFAPLVTVRSKSRAYAISLAAPALMLGWWLSLEPSNARNWQRDVAQAPTAEIQGSMVTIRNVRDFTYRTETDYTERWDTRSYDLSRLQGLDLFMIYWGSPSIAHTILSWQFDDGRHLAVSIETRKEIGESYSAVRGLFRQYEIYYVVGDERDLVGLRSNYRREDVYLYRLRTPPARARAILLEYLETINRLAGKPQWYNALQHNCTTTIRMHTDRVVGGIPYDWRWLANGYLDVLLYNEGVLNRELPFAELKSVSYINPKAQAVAPDGNFFEAIRKGLPKRPPPPAN